MMPRSDALLSAGFSTLLRLAVAFWGFNRFPPHDDGTFYDVLARRLAEGQGYTWLWPDGAVTPTAHYPVGYPALLGGLYRLLGAAPGWGMVFSALLAGLATYALHRALVPVGRRGAAAGALLFGLHPALVSYTPALMTEGITASLYALILSAFVSQNSLVGVRRGLAIGGLVMLLAGATYVRPQSVLLAPLLPLGLVLVRGQSLRARGRLLMLGFGLAVATLLCVAPWTQRNCERMGTCGFVSYNGGWNLLIAANPEAKGVWAEVVVPEECRLVFDEAKKDACFGQAARRLIANDPLAFAALIPAKLSATFDYFGAGPYYLHASNGAAFGPSAKTALGVLELIVQRLVMVFLVFSLLPAPLARRRLVRWVLAIALCASGWIGVVTLLGLCLLRLRHADGSAGYAAAAAILAATVITHMVFFGAGRYGLVVIPAFAWLFGCEVARWQRESTLTATDLLTRAR